MGDRFEENNYALNEATAWAIPVFCLDAKGIVSLNEGLLDKAN